MIRFERGRALFGFGSGSGKHRDIRAIAVMGFLALAILVYMSAIRFSTKRSGEAVSLPDEVVAPVTDDATEEYRRQVIEYRRREAALKQKPDTPAEEGDLAADVADVPKGPEAGAAETAGPAPKAPAIAPWRPRTGEEISPEDREWLSDAARREEAARTKFKPLLEDFEPIPPEAVVKYRIAVRGRIAAGAKLAVTLPGAAGLPIVAASIEKITREKPDGEKTELAWSEVPHESLYALVREIAGPGAPMVGPKDLLYLAQLASLAGKQDEAAELRLQSARLHFRERLGDAAREGVSGEQLQRLARKLVGAAVAGEAADTERAHDALHLARLVRSSIARAAGESDEAAKEAAALAAKAVELHPGLADEAALRAQITPNSEILEEYSWAWDPENPAHADADSANSLADDAPSIFHLYRYMRTLGTKRLSGAAWRRPPYGTLLRRPRLARGRVVKIRGGFIRRYRSMDWTKRPGHLAAGLPELEFCFVSDPDTRGGIYLVSLPHETAGFKRGDFVTATGVYLRRWPYRKDGAWKWIPWITAMKMSKVAIASPKGWGAFILALLVLGFAGGVVLFFAARREWRLTMENRERLHARRRGGRDHIRRKVAAAMKSGGAGKEVTSRKKDGAPPRGGGSDGGGPGDKAAN